MICKDLSKVDFSKLNICFDSIIKYHPKLFNNTVINRRKHSFLFIVNGKYQYSCGENIFIAGDRDVVYLPKCGNYSYRILSDDCLCYQFEFDISEADMSDICFLQMPAIMLKNSGIEIENIFDDIYNCSAATASGHFKILSDIYLLFSLLTNDMQKSESGKGRNKILSVRKYIDEHYKKKIKSDELCNICYLSNSQIRRLFKNEYGISPIAYKNRLRIAEACKMIDSECYNISEISQALAFENTSDFCRCFKKTMNISPKSYQQIKKMPK